MTGAFLDIKVTRRADEAKRQVELAAAAHEAAMRERKRAETYTHEEQRRKRKLYGNLGHISWELQDY